MKELKINKILFHILALVLAFGLALSVTVPVLVAGVNVTTITASKTSIGFWEITYDWALTKTVDPTAFPLVQGESGTVEYTITATRTQVSYITGVRGTITVTNSGAIATAGLTIMDQVQSKIGSGQFQNVYGATQIIIPAVQLAPGETGTYNYEIHFTPVAGYTYRNSAVVTILNHSEYIGTPFGLNPKADFTMPTSPILIDVTASLDDVEAIPTGFNATVTQVFPVTFTDTGGIVFDKTVKNDSARAGTYYLDNTATLTESTSGQTHTASARVTITVPVSGPVMEQTGQARYDQKPP